MSARNKRYDACDSSGSASAAGVIYLRAHFSQSRFSVSLCARIAQSAIIAAARAMPVVTIGANSAAVFQKAAFQRNSTAMVFRSFCMAQQKSPALGGAKGRVHETNDKIVWFAAESNPGYRRPKPAAISSSLLLIFSSECGDT